MPPGRTRQGSKCILLGVHGRGPQTCQVLQPWPWARSQGDNMWALKCAVGHLGKRGEEFVLGRSAEMTERDSQQRPRGGQQGQPWSLRCHPPKLPISDGALLQKKAHTLFFSRNHVIWVYRDGSFRSEVDFSKGSHPEQGQGGCSEPRLAAPAEGWAPMLMQTRERSCRQICVAEATAGSSRQPWGPPPAHVCEGCRGGSQSGSLVWVGERR